MSDLDVIIAQVKARGAYRARCYPGQRPRPDEMLVEEVERLRRVIVAARDELDDNDVADAALILKHGYRDRGGDDGG